MIIDRLLVTTLSSHFELGFTFFVLCCLHYWYAIIFLINEDFVDAHNYYDNVMFFNCCFAHVKGTYCIMSMHLFISVYLTFIIRIITRLLLRLSQNSTSNNFKYR